jgi:hypothetical protein
MVETGQRLSLLEKSGFQFVKAMRSERGCWDQLLAVPGRTIRKQFFDCHCALQHRVMPKVRDAKAALTQDVLEHVLS